MGSGSSGTQLGSDTWMGVSDAKHDVSGLTSNEIYDEGDLELDPEKKILLRVSGKHKHVRIPEFVETVARSAFQEFDSFKLISFRECSRLKSIPADAFGVLCFIEKLILPANFEDISGISREFVRQVAFGIGNPNFECFDDFVMSTDSRILWRCFGNCKKITIPCYVEKIGSDCFSDNTCIKRVIFEEGSELRVLEAKTFYRSSLASIVLPDSLEVIGDECFCQCENLREIDFPDSLIKIGKDAFAHSGIKRVSFASSESRIKEFGESAFYECHLTSIVLPKSLQIIGNYCFRFCKKLRKLTVLGSVSSIGEYTFWDCEIKRVSLVNSPNMETLCSSMFSGFKLRHIVIPSSVVILGEKCFNACEKLAKVSFEQESRLREIGDYCFDMTAIKSITIPRTVRTIGESCFSECKKLHQVCFETGSELTSLGSWCFFETSIERICLPKSIEDIDTGCFKSCKRLSELRFEQGSVITELGDILGGDTSGVSVLIPKSVEDLNSDFLTSISHIEFEAGSRFSVNGKRVLNNEGELVGEITSTTDAKLVIQPGLELTANMFESDKRIKSVEFHSEWSGTSLKAKMFLESDLQEIVISKCVSLIEKKCFGSCKSLISVQFESGSELNKICAKAFLKSGLRNIVIPRSVEEIGESAFEECESLRDVKFESESKLTKICANAFKYCPLPSIIIPCSVEEIGESAFEGRDDLFGILNHEEVKNIQHVKFESESKLKKIGEKAFKYSDLRRIVIPRSVEEIGESAFEKCESLRDVKFESDSNLRKVCAKAFLKSGLRKIVIPRSVEEIEKSAFKCQRYLFEDSKDMQYVEFEPESKLQKIGEKAFKHSGLQRIVIPRSVQKIGSKAFMSTKLLEQIEFEPGSELQEISTNAFAYSGLKSIIIPRSVTDIRTGAFSGSGLLNRVEFESESRLKTIESDAFKDTSLRSISIPDSVMEIGDGCFANKSLIECIVGEESQLVTLGDYIFRQLPHFFVPSGVVNMTGASLSGIEKVTFSPDNHTFSVLDNFLLSHDQTLLYSLIRPVNSIVIPRKVKVIKKFCFGGMEQLESVEFEEGSELEVVEEGAFSNTSIIQIQFPRNLRELKNSFCKKLSEIRFHDDCPLEEISWSYGMDNAVLHVPSNVRTIDKYTLSHYKAVKISERNPHLSASSHVVYRSSGDFLDVIGAVREIVVPKPVTRIPSDTFQWGEIISVMFEEGSELTEIGKGAFFKCKSLKVVSLANVSRLKKIENRTFYKCYQLSIEICRSVEFIEGDALTFVPNVSIQEGSKYLSISNEMILDKKGTKLMGFFGAKLQKKFKLDPTIQVISKSCFREYDGEKFEFEKGSALESIEDKAFYEAKFSYIEIPLTVVKIGNSCFSGCKAEEIHFQMGSKLSVFSEGMFACSKLISITIPASVIELGLTCFKDARHLKRVHFEEHSRLICIRRKCFSGCERLDSFEFERCRNLRYIHEDAFSGTKILKVILHPQVEFISRSAFADECEISTSDGFEDTQLKKWTNSSRCWDFVRERENNFYLGHDFIRTKTLGSGSFGDVYLYENRFTSERFAVKEAKESFTDRQQFEREIELMTSLEHSRIISLKGYNLSPRMSMCMEFASEGTLEDALSTAPDWFDSTCKMKSIVGIACGMRYIHSHNIIHRDLKPSNVLFDSYRQVKISDFGTARFDSGSCTMNIGTPLYMAPEMASGSSEITQRVDVFSFGLIVYQIIEGVSVSSLKERIRHGLSFRASSEVARNLIEACLDPDPSLRPTFSEIVDELESMEFSLIEGQQ